MNSNQLKSKASSWKIDLSVLSFLFLSKMLVSWAPPGRVEAVLCYSHFQGVVTHPSKQNSALLFIKFIGWYWLMKLHRCPVHNCIIRHLSIALCVPHSARPSSVSMDLAPLPFATRSPLPFGSHHTIVRAYEVFVCLVCSYSLLAGM